MRADNASDAAGRRDDPARQGSVAGRLGRSCGHDNRRMSAKELDPKMAADTAPVELAPGARTALQQLGAT